MLTTEQIEHQRLMLAQAEVLPAVRKLYLTWLAEGVDLEVEAIVLLDQELAVRRAPGVAEDLAAESTFPARKPVATEVDSGVTAYLAQVDIWHLLQLRRSGCGSRIMVAVDRELAERRRTEESMPLPQRTRGRAKVEVDMACWYEDLRARGFDHHDAVSWMRSRSTAYAMPQEHRVLHDEGFLAYLTRLGLAG